MGNGAKRATVREGYLFAGQAHVSWREKLSQNRGMAGKEGVLSQKKVVDIKRRVATTVFIHSATGMSHTSLGGESPRAPTHVT
jgi:hypothetical protein